MGNITIYNLVGFLYKEIACHVTAKQTHGVSTATGMNCRLGVQIDLDTHTCVYVVHLSITTKTFVFSEEGKAEAVAYYNSFK